MSKSAMIVYDQDSEEIKIFIGDELKGQYKDRHACATHFSFALMRLEELEPSHLALLEACKAAIGLVHDEEVQKQLKAAIEFASDLYP